MDKEFDHKKWDTIQVELLRKYPHLTHADLIWRHETKNDFFMTIASELGITKNELEQMIEQF